jgi:hypothetical protein
MHRKYKKVQKLDAPNSNIGVAILAIFFIGAVPSIIYQILKPNTTGTLQKYVFDENLIHNITQIGNLQAEMVLLRASVRGIYFTVSLLTFLFVILMLACCTYVKWVMQDLYSVINSYEDKLYESRTFVVDLVQHPRVLHEYFDANDYDAVHYDPKKHNIYSNVFTHSSYEMLFHTFINDEEYLTNNEFRLHFNKNSSKWEFEKPALQSPTKIMLKFKKHKCLTEIQ